MSTSPFPSSQQLPNSSAIGTSSPDFIETLEYRRFVEFCDACRQYRYIGLCFGPPGVGKTLSALRYSRSEMIGRYDLAIEETALAPTLNTVFYTPLVMNSPSCVDSDIKRARERWLGWCDGRYDEKHMQLSRRFATVTKRTGQRTSTFPPKGGLRLLH